MPDNTTQNHQDQNKIENQQQNQFEKNQKNDQANLESQTIHNTQNNKHNIKQISHQQQYNKGNEEQVSISISQKLTEQTKQIPIELQEIIPIFVTLKQRLRWYPFIILLLSILNIQNFRSIEGEYWYINMVFFILSIGDIISWWISIYLGKKIVINYQLQKIPPMVFYVKLSLAFATLGLLVVIIQSILLNDFIFFIITGASILLWILFYFAGTYYFIVPGDFMHEKLNLLKKQYPDPTGDNSLPMILKHHIEQSQK